MTINTNAKTRAWIGSEADNAIALLDDFEAVDWIEINEIEDIGEFGVEGSEQTFLSLKDGYVRKLKGSLNSGTLEMICARDPSDTGQNLARTAAGEWDKRPFKIQLADRPTPTGEDTVYYFRAPVMSAKSNYGNADNIVRTTFSLSIDGQILELPAEATATIAPAPGALPAGTEGVAYPATITASGGVGTVSYAVTDGDLSDGRTLNVATGAITGTPSADGTSNFTVTATYSGSGEASAAYSIVVAAA